MNLRMVIDHLYKRQSEVSTSHPIKDECLIGVDFTDNFIILLTYYIYLDTGIVFSYHYGTFSAM